MKIERIFNEDMKLEDIINSIVDANLNKNFEELLNHSVVQATIENNHDSDYTVIEKIDCVAQDYENGGTQ